MMFRRKKKELGTLADFISQCEQAVGAELYKQMPVLTVEVLPIEIPLIFKPGLIDILSLYNVDGDDVFEEQFKNGRTKKMVLGISKGLSIEGQIQMLLKMAVQTIGRNKAFAPEKVKEIDIRQVADIQQQTDIDSIQYANKMISSLGSEKLKDVLLDLFNRLGTVVKFQPRKRLFADDSARKRRYQLYDEIYNGYDFVKNIIDNLVASATGRNFKFASPVLEFPSDPILNHLHDFALRSQLHKTINHFYRDACLYGDGFAKVQIFYDEVFMTLVKPDKVTPTGDQFLVDWGGKTETVPRIRMMHFQHTKWDDSGFGVSDIEPLVSGHLKIKYYKKILSSLENRFNNTLLLEQLSELNKMITVWKKSIDAEENGMKSILSDPTEKYIKRTTDLYVC